MEYDLLEGEVISCNLGSLHKTCGIELSLQASKRLKITLNNSALKISYHLGFLFTKLKKLYRSVQRMITALKSTSLKKYVQWSKICGYTTLVE